MALKNTDKQRKAPRSPENLRERWNKSTYENSNEKVRDYFERVKKFIVDSKANKKIDFTKLQTPLFPLYEGKIDLGGINLSGGEIFENFEISNVNFESATFDNKEFDTIIFNNVVLDNSDFKNAILRNITFQENVSISSINISGAEIYNWMGLTDKNISLPIIYSKPWYINLFLKSLALIITKDFSSGNYTSFKKISLNEVEESSNKEFVEYIKWHQHVMYKFEKYREYTWDTWKDKSVFIFNMIFTRYFTSFSVLAFWAFLFNFTMAYLVVCHPSSFHHITNEELKTHPDYAPFNIGTTFYYSVITFTTLGYGDIYPLTFKAQLISNAIVLTGYFTLGTIIYLISRKIDKMF